MTVDPCHSRSRVCRYKFSCGFRRFPWKDGFHATDLRSGASRLSTVIERTAVSSGEGKCGPVRTTRRDLRPGAFLFHSNLRVYSRERQLLFRSIFFFTIVADINLASCLFSDNLDIECDIESYRVCCSLFVSLFSKKFLNKNLYFNTE